MQGVASLVLMPHKTTGTRCSVSSASTEVGAKEKSPSLSNPSETKAKEGIYGMDFHSGMVHCIG